MWVLWEANRKKKKGRKVQAIKIKGSKLIVQRKLIRIKLDKIIFQRKIARIKIRKWNTLNGNLSQLLILKY